MNVVKTLARNGALLLVIALIILPSIGSSQIDPAWGHGARIFEILDGQGNRLGVAVIAGSSNRGFEAGNEYWRFSETALLEIDRQESLEFTVWAEGAWDDPWVVRALGWRPEDTSVEWSHPAEVEWTAHAESAPPIEPGTYFGNATLGGLSIQYSPQDASSLTWFKLTAGDFMQLDDGAVFRRETEAPKTGSWWFGPIDEDRRRF